MRTELRVFQLANLRCCSDSILQFRSKISCHDLILLLVCIVKKQALTHVATQRRRQLHRRVALEDQWALSVYLSPRLVRTAKEWVCQRLLLLAISLEDLLHVVRPLMVLDKPLLVK